MKCFISSVNYHGTTPILFAIFLMTTMSVLSFLLDDVQSSLVFLFTNLVASVYLITIYKDYKNYCKDSL